ncbi:MAG: hypothetical protein GF344_08045 [Chitinivibrionales bacterium]|nr:hypothetical protein [Chitinivibrionales bacterium]MBD3356841.1 hypothetical protein [Chitinivibrionales bacterium]
MDESGTKKVTVNLPDNLTVFAIRAVAATKKDKFGFEKSEVSVRLPVIVQPSLPRFLRIGDSFSAGGVARVVEGAGGKALFSIAADGLDLGTTKPNAWNDITLPDKKARPIYVPMTVLPSTYDDNGKLTRDSITVRMSVRKAQSETGDAFRVSIPLLPDRAPHTNIVVGPVTKDSSFVFEKIADVPRPNTCNRYLLVSNQSAVIKVLNAIRYLILYPHSCTEQRVSRAYPSLAYKGIWDKIGIETPDERLLDYVNETLDYLAKVQTASGLFAYWPGGDGSINITAYSVEFLSMVKKLSEHNGRYRFDETVYERAIRALERAVRSDYSNFLGGYEFYERTTALYALAFAKRVGHAYAVELALFNGEADPLSQARIYTALHESGKTFKGHLLKGLENKLWNHLVFKKENGKEVFAGMQSGSPKIGAVMHGSQVNDLSGIVRAFARGNSKPQKAHMVTKKLIAMGSSDGWGNTHANGLALLALHDAIFHNDRKRSRVAVTLTANGTTESLKTPDSTGVIKKTLAAEDYGEISYTENKGHDDIQVMLYERYLPRAKGGMVEAVQEGFAVKRRLIYVHENDSADTKVWIDSGGMTHTVNLGATIEEHVQVSNPKTNHFVAVSIPLAAGFEYLNPELKTASKDFHPKGRTPDSGTYNTFLDDRIVYYFNRMEAGTYDFYFRVRATTSGTFTQPPAHAELMYQQDVFGHSPGTEIQIVSKE